MRTLQKILFFKYWWLFAVASTVSSTASAFCSFAASPYETDQLTVAMPTKITIPRDTPNGTVIATSRYVPPTKQVSVRCSGDPIGVVNSVGIQPGSNVREFPIGSTGLSYRWMYNTPTASGVALPSYSGPFRAAGTTGFGGTTHAFQLVKTGPLEENIVIPPVVVGTFNYGNLVALRLTLNNAIQIVAPTCRVVNPNLVVPLTAASGLAIKTFTGVGSTSADVPIPIDIDCSGVSTKVYMTLTDHQNPANTSTTLPVSTSATARGVGVQISYGTQLIRFGPPSSAAGNPGQFFAFNSGGVNGSIRVIMNARYVQTAAQVTPGTANALATFTMSYQ